MSTSCTRPLRIRSKSPSSRLSIRNAPIRTSGAISGAMSIEIVNLGDAPVTLMERHWRITDAHGRQQEVRGPGVVGEQPTIEPGKAFRYTSGCPLTTPSGVMVGEYRMIDPDGREFRRLHPRLLARFSGREAGPQLAPRSIRVGIRLLWRLQGVAARRGGRTDRRWNRRSGCSGVEPSAPLKLASTVGVVA